MQEQSDLSEWRNSFHQGDAKEQLAELPESSVNAVVCSPPYWGLRSYEAGDDQIGLEETPEAYVESIVDVAEQIARVLRPDGSFWLNVGDTYAGGGGVSGKPDDWDDEHTDEHYPDSVPARDTRFGNKNKLLIPSRIALALQENGWIIRNDNTWDKDGSQMPESVTDRCSTQSETVFHFVQQEEYYWDMESVKEDGVIPTDLWRVNTASFGGSACAVFPIDLLEIPIKATVPETVHVDSGEPCECSDGCDTDTAPGVVLDPFMGVGTTAIAAEKHLRDWVGIDKSSEYLNMARGRIEQFRIDPSGEGVENAELARKIKMNADQPEWWE
jgi:DNA modification methylase